ALQRRTAMADETDTTSATTKVQEVAASVQQAAVGRKRVSGNKAESVARRYFEAIGAHDLDAAMAMWAEGGHEHVRGQVDSIASDGVRGYNDDLLEALPDLRVEIVSTTAQGDRCAVQWRFTGTFAGPGQLNGVAPTGDPLSLEGLDLLTVRDGLIQSN